MKNTFYPEYPDEHRDSPDPGEDRVVFSGSLILSSLFFLVYNESHKNEFLILLAIALLGVLISGVQILKSKKLAQNAVHKVATNQDRKRDGEAD